MFKRMKLAPKLALVIGTVLTLIFVLLIVITISMSGKAISTATYGELNEISKSNGQQIQQIFNAAEVAATDMRSYLERAYQTAAADPAQMELPTEPTAIELCASGIYKQTLTPLNYDVEVYLRETARNAAEHNEDIVGIGAMFEPYKFQDNMRDYAFYIDEQNADREIEPFGAYSEYSQEDYYKQAAAAQKPVVTEPYAFNGITMVSYAMPILYEGELQGVVMADISVDNFDKINTSNEKYPSLYATIYNSELLTVYDSDPTGSGAGQNMSQFVPVQSEFELIKANIAKGAAFQTESTREDGRKVTRFFTPINAAGETWWSLTAVESKDIQAAVTSTAAWMLILSAAALLIILVTTVLLLRKMLSPMKPVVRAAEQIAQGHLDIQLANDNRDEIGILSTTFMEMAGSLKAMVSDVDYLLGSMADGNFNIRTGAEERYVGSFENLLLSMRKLNQRLSQALGQINQSADQVSAGAEQVSSGAQALSQGATEQASSVEELAATVNEISEQVRGTAENAVKARESTAHAGTETSLCNRQMQEMIAAMDEISKKSNQIGQIIATIENIAFQTNILALNAAVEAARAGAAGKGFAVVADEVRSLASKSAEASKNTAALIEGTIGAVKQGTRIANETAESLMKVVESAQGAAEIVERIADAAAEQSVSVAQVTQGIDQISSVVQTNSATAEESAAASEELSGQAQILKELVSQFKLKNTDKANLPAPPAQETTAHAPLPLQETKY